MTELNISGFILAILFVSLILSKKEKYTRDYLLAFFISILGTFMLIKYAVVKDLLLIYPIFTYLDIYYWVLLGPALFVYTIISTRGENQLKARYLYTLIPTLIVTICFYRYIFFSPLDFFAEEENIPIYVWIGYYIWMYNSVVFYILTIIVLRKHQNKIKNHYSYTKSVDLKWLYYLSHGFAVFLFFLLFRGVMANLFNVKISVDTYDISILVMVVYIFGIGYFGYKQRGIFNNYELPTTTSAVDYLKQEIQTKKNEIKKPYQKSGLSEVEAHEILSKLYSLMESDQPYLESELDLPALADMVYVSSHKLSQVINEYLNKNFFDFVNEYRIQKVKEHLTDPGNNQFKIISLAYDSGFNSKSTFYNFFKKIEGVTPAQYRIKHQKEAV